MHMRLAALSLLLLAVAGQAHASCAGRDLIAELKTANPAAYASVEAEARATPTGDGLLWRIESGAATPSFLFGTVHVSDPRIVTLAPEVRRAFEASSTLAVEIADLSDPELPKGLVKHALFEKGGTLDDIPPVVKSQIDAALEARGLPPQVAGYLKPWFLVLALGMPPCVAKQQAGESPDKSLDGSLIKSARDGGKPVVGLETPDEQIDAFKALDEGLVRRALISSARLEPLSEDLHETLLQTYLNRRIAMMEPSLKPTAALSDEEASDMKELTRAMTDDRNVTMVERGLPLVRTGGVFIAVGALHLPGALGLVEQFRRAGFTVTRVW
jgi:uncharacterized protein YbaP (TraB family)